MNSSIYEYAVSSVRNSITPKYIPSVFLQLRIYNNLHVGLLHSMLKGRQVKNTVI